MIAIGVIYARLYWFRCGHMRFGMVRNNGREVKLDEAER